jgi:hypothetical protein
MLGTKDTAQSNPNAESKIDDRETGIGEALQGYPGRGLGIQNLRRKVGAAVEVGQYVFGSGTAHDRSSNLRSEIADVSVGGVLCTLSAWVMGLSSTWFGLEPGRKWLLPLGLQLL